MFDGADTQWPALAHLWPCSGGGFRHFAVSSFACTTNCVRASDCICACVCVLCLCLRLCLCPCPCLCPYFLAAGCCRGHCRNCQACR